MKKLTKEQFRTLANNPLSVNKISLHQKQWFYTINLFATEASTGLGVNNVNVFKQTWELIDKSSNLFVFTMWGENPSPNNSFINSLHHEGKRLAIESEAIIELIKMSCLKEFQNPNNTDFELKNLRNCQVLSSLFNKFDDFPISYIENISKLNGQRGLIEVFFPDYFVFPPNSLKNDFSKAANLDSSSGKYLALKKKRFSGNLSVSPKLIKIHNNSSEFPEDYNCEKDFDLSISQNRCCLQINYNDMFNNISFELPIESFNLGTIVV